MLAAKLGLLVVVLMAATTVAESPGLNAWKYAESSAHRPVARSIGLVDELPEDFENRVVFRGSRQRYTQLRYGSENSRRVVLVVDALSSEEFDFYADLNRDRILTSDELISGQGRVRSFLLDAEIIREDQPQHAARRLTVRLGTTGKRLSVATVGFIEGSIPWNDENGPSTTLVRRVDGDANGLFADVRDRLLIDLNHDGQWHPLIEQFAYLPVLKLPRGRYAVRSDRLGKTLSLTEVNGTGSLRVVVNKLTPQAKLVAFEAMVFSDDGSAYSLKEMNQPLSVPVGRYAMGSVTMTIDTGDKNLWHFVFSRSGRVSDHDWQSVSADGDAVLEAIGTTRFELGTAHEIRAKPGEAVNFSPAMTTEAGLLINLCARGPQMGSFDRTQSHNPCKVMLLDKDQRAIAAAQSGFA